MICINKDNDMANYFNTLSLREQLAKLGKCEFMDPAEFSDGASYLSGKKLVIIVGSKKCNRQDPRYVSQSPVQ